MPSLKNKTPILSDKYYHLYNRGNNYENIFKSEDDYYIFVWLIKKYICPLADIFAYALLPNHYHFLIKTHSGLRNNEFSISYSKMIVYYTYQINKREGRSGSLLLNPFKRILIDSDEYFKRLVFYIHFNPQKHKIVSRYQLYKFSSYRAYKLNYPTLINKNDTIEIFGSESNFLDYHTYIEELDKLKKYSLE